MYMHEESYKVDKLAVSWRKYGERSMVEDKQERRHCYQGFTLRLTNMEVENGLFVKRKSSSWAHFPLSC